MDRGSEGGRLTRHVFREGDARELSWIPDESVHLVCTSPPYGSLKEYPVGAAQLGNVADYESFLHELDKVWAQCLRVLVPGGRVACVVGDVCIARRKGGRHHVLPLSADVQVRARHLGFDNLTPIRWLKVANIALEASRSSRFLGKPNLPNGVVKNDLEHILLLRKPGRVSQAHRRTGASVVHRDQGVRQVVCADLDRRIRPAAPRPPGPYPLEVPRRLIRMFSFVNDTVLDPFAGTGTTALAAMELGRHSMSVEIEPSYVNIMEIRLRQLSLASPVQVQRWDDGGAAAAS